MSQQQSGELGLKVDDAVKRIEDTLNKMNDKAGLRLSPVEDISVYLNYDDAMLTRLTAEDAGNGAFMVSRHAMYIKQLYNREMSIIKWTRGILNGIATNKAKQYADAKYLKLDEKIAVVVSENEYAREIHKALTASELKASELHDMHAQLNILSDKLTDVQRTKRSERFQK